MKQYLKKNNERGSPRAIWVNVHSRGRLNTSKLLRQFVAIFVAITVWFSFNLGASLQAAQNDSIGATANPALSSAESASSAPLSETLMSHTPEIAIAAVSLISISLLGYNLVSSGKGGWGWMTLCIVATILAMFGKMIVSLFQEISAANSIADWDGD